MGQQSRVGVFDLRKSPHYNINNDTPTKRIMNYLKQYCNLIRKAENRTPPEGYTEKHHTFPKSIFGKNNRIVVLTAREHYIAHALLEKICVKRYGISHWKTYKMIKAHISMKCGKYFNNRLYESSRVRYGNSIKGENNPFYNKFHTEEAKLKMSKKRSGKNNCMFGKKRTDEVKEKIKEKLSFRHCCTTLS